MCHMNHTTFAKFILLGFPNFQVYNPLLFVIFLFIYILTLAGNLLIIILVCKSQSLRTPMYFFLTQLSMSDILITTNISPNMLRLVLNGGGIMHVSVCITQFYVYGSSATVACLFLTVMSYDRYLAICKPLHYSSIMDTRLRYNLVFWSWALAFMVTFFIVLLICNLKFCGSRVIDHYFCDLTPLLELSCSDHSIVEIVDFILAIPFTLFPFVFIIYTYVCIFLTILGITSTIGRQKAFSTCSSHLIVVSMYYGTLIIVYMIPSKGYTFNLNKIISLLYTMGTPFFNPIIYSLRNKDIKMALMKCTSWCKRL
ncbi:olfactory receptor 6B1-like [Bombina bombina]|uniref:olfactory receptor 6B1-like n=1 Tax=Bombina bombina TaxID=8345 RepID=UPI00235A5657|nr:olfactory receptor 6B1-like [Bombina bombina]